MPYYYQLKAGAGDPPELQARKLRVAQRLALLREQLAAHLTAAGSLADARMSARIATWNLREFGGSKYGGRDFEALYYIAEIISHFDIVALQEVRGDLREFRQLMQILGPDWDYVATDVTDGDAGNGERMVFVYNRRHVQFRNIAGELTLREGNKVRAAFGERILLGPGVVLNTPAAAATLSGTHPARLRSVAGGKKLDSDLEIPLPAGSSLGLPEGASLVVVKNTAVASPAQGQAELTLGRSISGSEYRLRLPPDSFDDSLRQFARTPYLLSFQAGWLTLNLCTVHIYYGDDDDPAKLEQRRSEIELLARALATKAEGEFRQDDKSFTCVLGDFNIIGHQHPTMAALTASGFEIPLQLQSVPGSNVSRNKAYDQIAFWMPQRSSGYARLEVLAANIFDYYEHVFTEADEPLYRAESATGLKPNSSYRDWRTYKLSDHLPMWVELRTDFGDAYLEAIERGDA